MAAKAGLLQVCLHFLYWLVSLHRQCQDVLAIKGKKTKLSVVVYHQNIMVVRAGFYLDQKYLLKFRPSLTRAETIDSCNSEDLITVLEVHDRKPYKIIDRCRENKKGVMAESLDELIERGK